MLPRRAVRWIDRAVNRLVTLLPDRAGTALLYWRKLHRFPNLKRPTRFTELVQLRKLDVSDQRLVDLTDKIIAKQYVSTVLGAEWIIPTVWTGTVLPPPGQRDWATPFVVKANFGSGYNHFVFDEAEATSQSLKSLTSKWMRSTYKPHLKEKYQDRIDKRLLIEPFLGLKGKPPSDYKFYCFGGNVECILVLSDRDTKLKGTAFTPGWEALDLEITASKQDPTPSPPHSLKAMLRAAELLSEPFPFVRIDFYDIDGTPKFGEFTFTPYSGFRHFKPAHYDADWGRLWIEAAARLSKSSL